MPDPNEAIADAIREVTASVEKAIAEGYRARAINADDLVEVLLAIADKLDPPVPGDNTVACHCPDCGESDADCLEWIDDDAVRCATCGTIYLVH